jgi:hypothetical protein
VFPIRVRHVVEHLEQQRAGTASQRRLKISGTGQVDGVRDAIVSASGAVSAPQFGEQAPP